MAANTYIALDAQTVSSPVSSIVFSGIPQTYTDLVIVAQAAVTTGSVALRMQFNADAGANYSSTWITGNGTTASAGRTSGTTYMKIDENSGMNTVLGQGLNIINILNYANTTTYKTVLTRPGRADLGTDGFVGLWRGSTGSATQAITSVTLLTSSSTFIVGSKFALYGILAEPASGTGSKAIGGTVTTSGGYTYHTFTSAGMFQPTASITGAEVLVVAGGGGGGHSQSNRGGGAGGAGGLVYASSQSFSIGTNVPAIVGSGGASLSKGNNSTFGSVTAAIGGGTGSKPNDAGGVGGSGGGAAVGSGGAGTAGQGNAGGSGYSPGGSGDAGGGGGGAGAAGGNGAVNTPGVGGVGVNTYSTWASATSTGASGYYAGGGGGSGTNPASAGAGGLGGGGAGSGTGMATNGTANTGGGGGSSLSTAGANGGSGIVIVRYTT